MNISTGITALDKITSGLSPGKLYAICSRPKIGKTSLIMTICSNVAFKKKIPTAFFSLECSFKQIISRLHLMEVFVKESTMHAIEWKPESIYSTDLHNYPGPNSSDLRMLYIDDDPIPNIDTITKKIMKLANGYGVRLVCIDYLELIASNSQHEDVLQHFKSIATELNIAIVITSMLHRFSYAQDDCNPTFCSKQNIIHKDLINKSDMVLVIHRPEIYIRPDCKNQGYIKGYSEVHMLKDNYINANFVPISFNCKKRRFENYTSEIKSTIHRFISAQNGIYNYLLMDLKSLSDHPHWMWFIFPRLKGLECSSASTYYGLDSIEEARSYLENSILGTRLRDITNKLLSLTDTNLYSILGSIDIMKLRSCMTLFDIVSPTDIFNDVLIKFFEGKGIVRH